MFAQYEYTFTRDICIFFERIIRQTNDGQYAIDIIFFPTDSGTRVIIFIDYLETGKTVNRIYRYWTV